MELNKRLDHHTKRLDHQKQAWVKLCELYDDMESRVDRCEHRFDNWARSVREANETANAAAKLVGIVIWLSTASLLTSAVALLVALS